MFSPELLLENRSVSPNLHQSKTLRPTESPKSKTFLRFCLKRYILYPGSLCILLEAAGLVCSTCMYVFPLWPTMIYDFCCLLDCMRITTIMVAAATGENNSTNTEE